MKRASSLLVIPSLMGFALAVGCANKTDFPKGAQNSSIAAEPTRPSSPKAVVDIPGLINKSTTELDKVFGKPRVIMKVSDAPDMMPGEYRDYRIEGARPVVTKYGLMIRIFKGRAVHFTFDLPRSTQTPEEALLMAGIDVNGTAAMTTAPHTRWSGTFNGIDFKEVGAFRMDPNGTKYTTVEADVSQ